MKKALLERWRALEERYKALQSRERLLLATCLMILPGYLLHSLLYTPLERKQSKGAQAAIVAQRSADSLKTELSVLQARLAQSPDAPLEAELAALTKLQSRADSALAGMSRGLVSPSEMNTLLKGVLGHTPGLRLIRLVTQPPESALATQEGQENSATEKGFDLYKHGVELTVEGRYEDLQNYLLQLESQEKQLLWDSFNFQVEQYPMARLTLHIHTLSVEKAWLSL